MKHKIFGGLVFINGKQMRCVVASTSQQKAAALAGINLGYLREYWSITGNAEEVAAAMAMPETALIRKEHWAGPFRPISEYKK